MLVTPSLGREHVRGADAGRCSFPRSAWRRAAGASTTRDGAAQIHHGLEEAGYGYWGFSPSNTPEGGYSVYGVDAIGMDPGGNPSNEDSTLVDHGFAGCPGAIRSPTRRRPPTRTAS